MAIRDAARWITAPPTARGLTEARPLAARHYALLFGALSMSLFAFVPGAYLVPALPLRDAILVAAGGSLAGAAMLAAVASAAAQRRHNTVGLLSSTLGVPFGGIIATLLFLRHVVWATFALAFAANVAAHVPGLGGSRVLWGVTLGALALALALLPVRGFVERWTGWYAVWVGLLLIAAITLTGVTTYGIPILHDADGLGGWPTRGQGFDLVAAMPLLWLPVVADYACDARSRREAGAGTFAGAGVMSAWYAIVGVLWVFTISARDVAEFITILPIGAGALVVVIALQATPIAANLHAASLAGGRLGYRWFRPALLAAGVIAATVVVSFDALGIEDVALLLASILLPLFAVVVARNAVRAGPTALSWAAWIAGILAFAWINPGAVEPWHDSMHFIFSTTLHVPFPLGGDETQLPATAVSVAVAGGGYVLLALPWMLRRLR